MAADADSAGVTLLPDCECSEWFVRYSCPKGKSAEYKLSTKNFKIGSPKNLIAARAGSSQAQL
jgi:hypothetical protein